MSDIIKDYLAFNRTERKAILMLLLVLMSVAVINFILPRTTGSDQQDFSAFESDIQLFIERQKAFADSINNTKKKIHHNEARQSARYKAQIKDGTPLVYKQSYERVIIEINSADTLALTGLRGIGPYYARNIVKYRELLGGYARKEQLLEVYGMDPARYNGFMEYILIDTALVRKLDLNKVSFRELLRHPYFDYYLVKEILNLRQRKHNFKHVAELKELESIYPELYEKIFPYLSVNKSSQAVNTSPTTDTIRHKQGEIKAADTTTHKQRATSKADTTAQEQGATKSADTIRHKQGY